MIELINTKLLEYGSFYISVSDIVLLLLAAAAVVIIYLISKRRLHAYTLRHSTVQADEPLNQRRLIALCVLLWIIISVFILRLDYEIVPDKLFGLSVSRVLMAVFIVVLSRLLDSIISKRIDEELIKNAPSRRKTERNGSRLAQYIILLLSFYLIIKNFEFLNFTFYKVWAHNQSIDISLSNIVVAILVLLSARLIIWLLTNLFFFNFYQNKQIASGKRYAYNQLLSYLIYFFGILFALQLIGVNMTLVWTGAAALLVGIGIALQQTISDFFSGIVLLFERSVKVGDFLELDSVSGTLKRIGLRSSLIETLDNKLLIVPNSQLVNNRVTNKSNTHKSTRFSVSVGVAYGSDPRQVEQILLAVAEAHKDIPQYPIPFVRFQDFGESALLFELFAFTKTSVLLGDIRSDLRYAIHDQLVQHNIEIPFPQRDVWIKNSGKLK